MVVNNLYPTHSNTDVKIIGRIAYVVNSAAFFVSHRLPLAEAARDLGYEVTIILGKAISLEMETDAVNRLTELNFNYKICNYSGSSLNPLTELIGFIQLCVALLSFKPNLIHCVSPKGILYGGLASHLVKPDKVFFAISGLGYLFSVSGKISSGRKAVQIIYKNLLSLALRHKNKTIIVQNNDDASFVSKDLNFDSKDIFLISGSGVNLDLYPLENLKNKENIVLFASRLLAEKGVREFAEAAQILKKKCPQWRFVIAGASDYLTPSGVTDAEIKTWTDQGYIEYLGYVKDMTEYFSKATICCLPSYYREGLPKTLIEAAASCCAVVTTDSVGCRDAVVVGETGELVTPRSVDSLVNVLFGMLSNPDMVHMYGINGRRLAEKKWSLRRISQIHMALYQS